MAVGLLLNVSESDSDVKPECHFVVGLRYYQQIHSPVQFYSCLRIIARSRKQNKTKTQQGWNFRSNVKTIRPRTFGRRRWNRGDLKFLLKISWSNSQQTLSSFINFLLVYLWKIIAGHYWRERPTKRAREKTKEGLCEQWRRRKRSWKRRMFKEGKG